MPKQKKKSNLPIKLFMFRLWVYHGAHVSETMFTFTHTDNWDRAIIIRQLPILYPDATHFKLYDGYLEIEWDSTPDDVEDVIIKLNDPSKYIKQN